MCKENSIKNIVTLCKMATSARKPFCYDFTKLVDKKLLRDSGTFQTYQLNKDDLEVKFRNIS